MEGFLSSPRPVDAAPASPRLVPRRYGRARLALYRGVERACELAGGRAFYRRRHLAAGRFRVRRERVAAVGIPPGACLRIAHLSDLHAGPFLGPGDLAAVVGAANALEPDVVVLTGDYGTHGAGEAVTVAGDLARLEARLGAFAVFGNHDYRGREEARIAAAYGAGGIRFLRNEATRIELDGWTLALVGVEDLEEAKRVDIEAARASLRPGDVEVVLCHNPAGAPALARRGCAAVLSGHTHGTQVDLPLLRRLQPHHPGDRRELGGTAAITSRGLGAIGLPIRVGSPAELVCVELVPAVEGGRAR